LIEFRVSDKKGRMVMAAESLRRETDVTTSVSVVIPAYNPTESILDTVQQLITSASIIIVDDGSTHDMVSLYARCRAAGARVIELESNKGIAAALNRGISSALRSGCSHVLTLDQDSTLVGDYLEAGLEQLAEAAALGFSVSLIGPSVQNGKSLRYLDSRGRFTIPLEPIQSGSIVPRGILLEHGLFDEGLFIDCVDTDFVLRLRRAGFEPIAGKFMGIRHTVGIQRSSDLPRGSRFLSNRFRQRLSYHTPTRRYYITRNRIIVYRRYGAAFPRWFAISVFGETKEAVRSLIAGPQKCRQLLANGLGLWHGVKGVTGPAPKSILSGRCNYGPKASI
jgi:rhamnosyltransferase